MKFKVIIDPEREEEVVVYARVHTPLIEELERFVLSNTGADSICVYTDDTWKVLPYAEIECITAVNGKVYATDIQGQQYRLKQRLYELEEKLPCYFIRINKSAIANEKRIDRFCAGYSGSVDAVFKCGCREYVSRRCFAQIRRRYEIT
ncbi:MAG: LytTR family transcriptional regulator [Oscillospiraceae bacterium]|nr:LytTR family transcriptional regulator [Oscillospiraceae bacterium]